MTLCNMVVEAGGKNGIVAADRTTYKYLEVVGINRCPLCSQFHCLHLLLESNLVICLCICVLLTLIHTCKKLNCQYNERQ